MKRSVKGRLIIMLLFTTAFVSSCHKENTSFDYNQTIETVSDYVEAQQMTNLLLNTYFKSITDSILFADGTAEIDGADVSYSSNPAKIIIEYPHWGRDDGYGHFRQGIYEVTTESGFFDSLAVVNFAFINFFYDYDSIIIGNLSITNSGTTTNDNNIFNVVANNVLRKFHDTTGYIKYNVEQSYIRIKDSSSPYYSDNDHFEITGNLSGLARNGHTYNSTTQDTSSLMVYYSCRWIRGGITEVELPEFIHNATVNFNNGGECLNQYSIITNETLFTEAFDIIIVR